MAVTELAAAPTTLRGVGPTRAHLLGRLGITTVGDLLFLLPGRYEDRSQIVPLAIAAAHGEGLVRATVVRHEFFPHGGRRVLKIVISDESGAAVLVCFGRNVLAKTFPPGSDLLVFGSFSFRYGEIQSSSFEAEHVRKEQKPPGLLPVYPLTDGLTQRILRDLVATVLASPAAQLEDPLPPAIRTTEHLMSFADAIRTIHHPASLDAAERAFRRLRFGELFFFQLNLARSAMIRRRSSRRARPTRTRHLTAGVRESLPFSLTEDQETVLREIVTDMEQPWPMNRLLHGDVGSGKTLVALLAALRAIERGEQAVLMVPTELLARQHAWTAAAILSQTDVNVALAIGAAAAPARRALREAVAAGEIDLVVGTHALFSADVIYANLGLVIIDEQHRFGVSQRRAIMERGTSPDLLLMSATPIPRSLALTAFGDSDVSAITHLPPGRKPIRTRLARMGNEERVYRFVHKELEAGRQAYFVYPAIDEGGTRGLRSAAEMAEILAERFAPYTVGVAHSRLDQEERAATMEQFKNGLIHVLVATSVVEVGVDVPNATCIVIEHAELFGLAALHQLRGRVGRGEFQSHCILVYQEPLTDDAKERLRVLYQSNDGFHIAEEDLRIRGPGDLLGTRQAGFLRFRFADIRRDMELMLNARRHIAAILRDDPDLTQTEHRPAAAELTRAESAASEADR
ncbi:MAG: ATP-dependent DNA helicase RecG [Spirochaeta sp.]|jgi:ATP-dependent DNA helicase RecG|nr:ATP-dependent DNA helicase RecG [Spirochaeta sp.]